jgi:hypothetical protein
MGEPPVDWGQQGSAGYQPPSYSQTRQRPAVAPAFPPQTPQYPQQPGYPPPQPARYPQQYPTQQYPGQQYPQQQYPAQQYPGQQYPQQQYPAQQYPGQQYPPQQYPAQQYPGQQYPPYGAPPAPGQPGYPPQYQAGAPQPGYPAQQYPPYGAPPGQPVSPMKQPGGALVIVGMIFGMGSMISVLIGNVAFTGPPVPCLISGFISGIIGTALGAAAWAKGNKGGKGVVGISLAFTIAAVIIGLMWASVFG